MHWLRYDWWRYLLTGQFAYRKGHYWPRRPSWGWRQFWCRLPGHPAGVVWYTGPLAMEPDMHCRNCGDDLG